MRWIAIIFVVILISSTTLIGCSGDGTDDDSGCGSCESCDSCDDPKEDDDSNKDNVDDDTGGTR